MCGVCSEKMNHSLLPKTQKRLIYYYLIPTYLTTNLALPSTFTQPNLIFRIKPNLI